MRAWGRKRDELERRLRANRPEPSSELTASITGRLGAHRRPNRLGLALAVGLTTAALATLGAFGGVGYASSAAHSLGHTLNVSQHGKSDAAKGQQENGKGNQGNQGVKGDQASSADDQYRGKTTICHRTHSAKNPFVVISVSNNALPAHKAHGDTLVGPGGTCPGPPIP